MKRVGILTHYHNNANYGGVLQAYALTKVIKNMGFDAEQIRYNMRYFDSKSRFKALRDFLFYFKKAFKSVMKVIFLNFNGRLKAISKFRDIVPHSKNVYDYQTIDQCVKDYDIFITGSDQVWNFAWYESAFFLDFVPSDKTKISYAASIGNNLMTEEQKKTVSDSLADFDAVSVRELDAKDIIAQCTQLNVEHVLDPTLLLNKDEWENICSPRIVKEKYIFCYFLTCGAKARALVKEFAAEQHLKIVTLPHLFAKYRKLDFNFADINLYRVSPADFISLIKNAEYVFTDSFHASVFSGIYEKQFFVFHRYEGDEMSSRIYSLMELFGCKQRIICKSEHFLLEHLNYIGKKQFALDKEKLDEIRTQSLNFLYKNIKINN